MTRHPRRPRSKRVRVLLVKFGLAFLVAELTLRLVAPNFNISPYWRYHPTLGWTQVPGLDSEFRPRGNDGPLVRIRFNSLGFRDREHEITKRNGTKRIVVVGDSFCEAIQVDLESTFHQLLESRLNAVANDETQWEMINLGVGDFGTSQAMLALENYGWLYTPDIVICQIFPLNDIGNNSIDLAGLCRSKNDGYRPYALLPDDDGDIHFTTAQPRRNFLRRWWKCYGLVECLTLRIADMVLAPYDDAKHTALLADHGYTGLDPLLQTFTADADQAPAIAHGWSITEQMLVHMSRRCAERGVKFLVVVVPFEARIAPNWSRFKQHYSRSSMKRTYAEDRLTKCCEEAGIPAVMMRPIFDAHADEVLPYIDGHLNESGHWHTADTLFDAIATEGWTR